jgi:peptidyl-prolyl cis-trans isomerase C
MSFLRRHRRSLPSVGAVCLVAGLVAAGCTEKKEAQVDASVVATVNGEIISRADFARDLTRELASADPVEPRSPEQVEPYRRALLDELVDQALLQQAARKLSITATPEEVDRRVLRISADYPAEGFDEALAQGQLSMAELKRKTAALLVIEKLFDEHVYPRVAVTEEELRQYFEERREDFQEQEQVRAAQIVVRSLEEARKLQTLLRQGRKFPDLARKYSLSADARVGGDLGFFPRGVMPPAFDEVAFKLAVNQVSDVVSTEYGFHLFKVLERRPARRREFVEVRAQVEERLLKVRRAEAQRAFVNALREGAIIVVNEPVLQSITGRTERQP